MTKRQPWFQGEFSRGLPAHLLAVIVERLRGTPARLADRLGRLSGDVLTLCSGDTWSIQENVGHLVDLESLWHQRFLDLACAASNSRKRTSPIAGPPKQITMHAQLQSLLSEFRQARAKLVRELETFPDEMMGFTALHPRLKSPMNVVDKAFFVAEHDDYHLARISELLREAS